MSNNENIQITKEQTLLKMLEKHEIVIPIIQRDYAQGRENDNVVEIRENFIKDIFSKLIDNQKLKLSFVYGTEEGTQYIPYDGQQRLTLVYLLTLYLTEYSGERIIIESNNENINILSKFYYKTRDFSSDFCAYLTLNKDGFFYNNILSDIKYDKDHQYDLKNKIINDNNFFSAWLSDPTVSSMINVLQTIHIMFNSLFEETDDIEKRKQTALDFIEKLKNGFIFFDWCSLDKASDSIYVKMNGRGKMLSAFDNFKNTLYGTLNELREIEKLKLTDKSTMKEAKENLDFLQTFELKMDSKWTDLFWEYRKKFSETNADNINIAPAMMNFLYFAFEYRFSAKTKKFFFGKGEAVRWLDENKIVSFLSIFRDSFKTKKEGIPPVLNISDYIWISKLMDLLYNRLYKTDDIDLINDISKRKFFTEQKLFISLCLKTTNYDYRSHAIAALYYDYLVNYSTYNADGSFEKCEDSNKSQWAQFIFNIMETVAFFNFHYNDLINDKHFYVATSDFVSKAINISKTGSLPEIMTSLSQEEIDNLNNYFTLHADYQLQEEFEKWRLIKKDEKWQNAIAIAEAIPYFNGQIYFLIEASKDSEGKPNITLFKKLTKSAASLVNPDDNSKLIEDNLIRQLLLCFGDYRIDSKQGFSNTLSLCESKVHDGTATYYLWRSFFDIMYSDRANYITLALKALAENDNNIKEAIKKSKPHTSIENWQDVILTYPKILEYINPFGIVDTWEYPFIITAWNCKKQIRPEIHLKSYAINIMIYGLYRKLGFKDEGNIREDLFNRWKLPSGQIIEQTDENYFKLFEGSKKIGEGTFVEIVKIAKKA
jgi:hypothetical protein